MTAPMNAAAMGTPVLAPVSIFVWAGDGQVVGATGGAMLVATVLLVGRKPVSLDMAGLAADSCYACFRVVLVNIRCCDCFRAGGGTARCFHVILADRCFFHIVDGDGDGQGSFYYVLLGTPGYVGCCAVRQVGPLHISLVAQVCRSELEEARSCHFIARLFVARRQASFAMIQSIFADSGHGKDEQNGATLKNLISLKMS